MTELKLYKYIYDNNIEWHREKNNEVDDIIIFPHFSQIEDFHKITSTSLFDEEGVNCIMKDGYLCIWMRDICDHYDIEMEKVFSELKEW